ncbi:YdeI/OmpD-associated family protein [uncultured Tenacibaculum sp.]|uniref:YdeI/OmpD-associated family protein n=1 Tax=uncultured Tenacibaculum sp. TaxID=174713 RepID=UPI00262C0556|nr:YdeI/OmpD-associated family protein [uncultured Tenacibaculum sp.]
MAKNIPQHYFKTDTEWRKWLLENHDKSTGVHLILYKVDTQIPSMRWEEAVKVALCFGWIDSTVKSLGDGKRQQYFCPRKDKSIWSAVNKKYIKELTSLNLMHASGIKKVETAKKNGSWTALDDVENLIIPNDLQIRFNQSPIAFKNYQNFAKSYKKGYLYWLNQAKRETTRLKRLEAIIQLCEENKKER